MRRRPLAILLLALLSADGRSQGLAEDGAFPPLACWTTAGGSASRSGAAWGDPVRGPVEVAWRFPKTEALKGEIEGEPLVWDNRVVVVVTEGPKRTVQVLDLLDGRLICRGPSLSTTAPLEPCIWNGVLVLRTMPNKLEAWRLRGKDLEKLAWFFQAKAPLSAPVMIGREVYVRAGNSLVRLVIGRTDPVWERTSLFRGSPSVRGKHVYALDYDAKGTVKLAWVLRQDGAREGEATAGYHSQGRVPDDAADARIAILDGTIALQHALPVLSEEGPMSMTAFSRKRGPDGSVSIAFLGILPLCERNGVSQFAKGWVTQLQGKDGRELVAFEGGLDQGVVLADKALFTEFLSGCAPSCCGGVSFIGASAVDGGTRRILWSEPVRASARPVPARGTVLVVDSGQRLIALRRSSAGKKAPRLLPAAAESRPSEPVALGEARAMLRDGSVVDGKLVLDWSKGTLAKEGPGKSPPVQLDDVLTVESGSKQLLYAGPGDAAVRGMAQVVERGLGDAYAALAVEADKSQDVALVERLIGEAWERGATGKDLDRAEAKLRERLAQKAPVKPDEVRKILDKEKAALAEPAGAIWQRFESLPASASWELRAELLAAVLARAPDHAGACAVIRKQIPVGVVVPEPLEGAEWLDFVSAIRQTPIEIVSQPDPNDANPSHAERELGAAQASWRPDLVGIQSKSLLILSPLRQPGRIARCLSGGELVCETLEKLFAGGTVKRDKRHPIKLLLYESEKEYLEQSERAGVGSSHLSWTAGHYSPIEGVARMYLPPGKEDFARVFDVYAHEMTHAWIEERCPLFSSAGRGHMQRTVQGDWIVEGFATLIENFEFDLETRSCRTKSQPEPLEIVANAKDDDLHKWPTLYRARRTYFGALDPKPRFTAPSRWILGAGYHLSKINLFYAQAGATCLYLYEAENGKYRERLMKYLGDHYGARADQLEVQAAFGLSPEELGARVVEHAKSIAGHGGK